MTHYKWENEELVLAALTPFPSLSKFRWLRFELNLSSDRRIVTTTFFVHSPRQIGK